MLKSSLPLKVLQISGAAPADAGDGRSATFCTVRAMCDAGDSIEYAYLWSRNSPPSVSFIRQWEAECEGRLKFSELRNAFALTDCWSWATRLTLGGVRFSKSGLLRRSLRSVGNAKAMYVRFGGMLLNPPPKVVRSLQRIAADSNADVVQVDYPWMVRFPRCLPRTTPRVFVVHELQSSIMQQLYPGDEEILRIARRLETETLREYDAVITLCDEDAQVLTQEHGLQNVVVSPLAIQGITAESTSTEEVELRTPLRFTFLGGHSHSPNADAVRWLHTEIAPLIFKDMPDAVIRIVGSYPQSFQQELASERFQFAGFVDDVDVELRGSMFLCPLRIGSGMRIKILDAIRAGAVVLSTTLGARGLGLRDEQDVILCDNAAAFAAKAKALAAASIRYSRIAQNARRRVGERFSAEVVGQVRHQLLNEVVERFRQLQRA